ncbi:MAG: MgtC/SapB family protein [Polyangiaceae bacterium]
MAAGLLIGLEREQARATPEGGSFVGGPRSHALIGLFGGVTALLAAVVTPWLVPAGLIAVTVLVAVSYADDVRAGRDQGLTTEAATLVTFVLGVLAASQRVMESDSRRLTLVAALAVTVTLLLSARPWLKSLIERVSRDDLYAVVKFLIVAVVVLPLLPNRTYGPLDVLNPFKVGLMVVLIAGLGFVGYVASRVLGEGRGFAVTAILGGMVSSTAVTLSFAGRAKASATLARPAAIAIVLASTIMFVRVLVEVLAVYPPLARTLVGPIAAMATVGVAGCATLYFSRRAAQVGDGGKAPAVALSNPFELSSAVRFGALFAVILVICKAAQVYAGGTGMYLAAALAGTTDVDAITLSTASLAKEGGVEASTAVNTILIGAASNTLVKATMTAVVGGLRVAVAVLATFGAMLLVGALATFVL